MAVPKLSYACKIRVKERKYLNGTQGTKISFLIGANRFRTYYTRQN